MFDAHNRAGCLQLISGSPMRSEEHLHTFWWFLMEQSAFVPQAVGESHKSLNENFYLIKYLEEHKTNI